MTRDQDVHVPTPQFRMSLEEQIRTQWREHAAIPSVNRRTRWFKHAALLSLGLVLGVGTQIASAQVQDARQRSDLERALQVDLNVAVMRLQIAQEEHDRVRKSFEVGALSRQSLLAAAAQLRTAELTVARMQIDLAEIRATSASPRNELWAPLVAGRDFVRERLRIDLSGAQARLDGAQQAFDEGERNARVGTLLLSSLGALQEEVARANRELRWLATQVTLREEFLRDKSTTEQLARRAQRHEATLDLELAVARLRGAQSRLEVAKEKFHAGAGAQLDVKRAEVDVLERELEVQRLQEQLRKL